MFGTPAAVSLHGSVLLAAIILLLSLQYFTRDGSEDFIENAQQASLACLPCIADALYNQYGIPGAVFGAAAAAVVTALVIYGGTHNIWGGAVAGAVTPPLSGSRSPGDEVTTYIPGVSPLPDKGDIIYLPTQGASTVTNVYYDPDTFHPDGTPGGVIIETELGSVLVVGIDLDEQ